MSSGKHLICDIKDIKNLGLIQDLHALEQLLNNICDRYNFTILNKITHLFQPQGISIIYMLAESHISIHTFPEHRYISMDIYTCKLYHNNDIYNEIYNLIIEKFDAKYETPIIIDRHY